MKDQKFPLTTTRWSGWWWLALGALLVGAALRVWQWQLGTTLFMDELAVVHNLVTRSAGQLVGQPLAEAQVAPPLFLLAEKACLTWLGRSEQALRLPALLASLAALALFWLVAQRVLAPPLVPLALLTLAVGFTFVYYGTQVKQYASDTAIGLLVLWQALRLRDEPAPPSRFWVLAGLGGLVLPFYSQSSLMVFAGCGAALLLLAALDAGRPRLPATAAVVGAWTVGCGASLALAQAALQPVDRAFMHYFWREGLLPVNAHFLSKLWGDVAERWANGLGWLHPTSIWVVLVLVGVVVLWQRQRPAALLLLAPWAMSIAAAAAQQFPLRMRLMDFLVPSLILFVFVAFQAGVQWAWQRNRTLGWGALGICTLPVLYSTTRHNLPPYATEDAKTLYAKLAQVRRPTDAVYAYYGAGQYLRWYGPQYGLSPGSYLLGHCYRRQPGAERQYLKEVDALRGRRMWLLMTHAAPADDRALTSYLDAIGRRGQRLAVRWRYPDEGVGYPVVYAQLYDLTDAKQAARYSAATFPLAPGPAQTADDICWSCYGPQTITATN
ncbi:hypothetical protein HHL22_15440 [Hymenobacter sp. RP-2-7]|uniref:Glycosyltransferase RgtA/B/C/D-like domain-containing protein n=1 Tax=Hymenobacter polaris TaxID=2682546 RepID=A0A7Y0FNI0_9BACT|nr:glycosyltransferase family 39 protein [Hymenobacter polaris]NML66601.1 hypothetical protein [Hymenobacter polaris]